VSLKASIPGLEEGTFELFSSTVVLGAGKPSL
jgi:hypothetical protein